MTSQPMISRRAAIGGGIAGLAGLSGLMLFPAQLLAKEPASDAFVVLLKGRYQPVVRGPSLGLSSVNLDDGSYSTVPIYPVSGTPGNKDPNKAVGNFYVQFAGSLCGGAVFQKMQLVTSMTGMFSGQPTRRLDETTKMVIETAEVTAPVVSTFSDFRTVDGVKMAFVTEQKLPTASLRTTFSEVAFDVPVDDAKFSMPK